MKGRYRVILPDGSYVSDPRWAIAAVGVAGELSVHGILKTSRDGRVERTGSYRIFPAGEWRGVYFWPRRPSA